MSRSEVLPIAFALGLVALAFALYEVKKYLNRLSRRRREAIREIDERVQESLPQNLRAVEVRVDDPILFQAQAAPQRESISTRIVTKLREKQSAGVACEDALRNVIDEFADDGQDEMDIINLTPRAGYIASDVAAVMVKWNHDVSGIKQLLEDGYHMGVSDIAAVLNEVFADKPVEARIKAVINVFEDEDMEDLIPVLVANGHPPVAIARMVYETTDLTVADLILRCGFKHNLAMLAEFVKAVGEDLADADEYAKLRDDYQGNLSFELVAKMLFATGKSAAAILEAENDYDEFDFSEEEHRCAPFDALRPCGVSEIEILKAIDELDLAASVGDIILAALESDVSPESIIKFLEPNWIDDLSGLWELLEEAEVSTVDAIEVLHALIPAEKRRWRKLVKETDAVG